MVKEKKGEKSKENDEAVIETDRQK